MSGAAAEIDAGKVAATLSALLGGYATQTDHAAVTATFLNAAAPPAGAIALPTVTSTDRNLTTRSSPGRPRRAVPAGTRQISVRIDAIRDDGSYNDGYIDNVSLVLGPRRPPVFHKTVVVKAISGKVRVRRPGSNEDVDLTGSERHPARLDGRHAGGVVELSSVPKAGGQPQTAKFYEGVFKVTQTGSVTQLALTEPLASCRARGGRERGGDQEEAAPPLGRRQGLVPHGGQVQLGHRPRHEVARQGQLRRHPDPRRPRHGHGPRQGAREDRDRRGGQELPGEARAASARAAARRRVRMVASSSRVNLRTL